MLIDYKLPHEAGVGVPDVVSCKKYDFVDWLPSTTAGESLMVLEDRRYFDITGQRYYFAIRVKRSGREWTDDVYYYPYLSGDIKLIEKKEKQITKEYFAVQI